MRINFLKGQTLIELLLAMGLAALIFPILLAGFMSSREGRPQQEKRLQAIALLKETETAVKNIRNNGWSNFANVTHGISYHTEISGSNWILASGTQTINDLTQSIVISSVYRNTNGDIVVSGGTVDPSIKKVVITISWTTPTISSITSTLYLTRTTNLTYTESTFVEFSAGTETDVVVALSSGSQTDGQIQLGAGGGDGDWCEPSFLIDTVDLPKSGVANAVTALAGPAEKQSTVFAGTGENASGVSFAKVNLIGNPPDTSSPIAATFDGYKTNAVFGESGYAYLATDNNFKEIEIIDLNNIIDGKYQQAGSINLPGNINGSSIFAANDKAYVTASDNKFYIYSLSSDRTSSTLLNSGGLTLDGEGKKVLVAGNYAYIATNSTTYQLEIVDVSNTSSPSIVGRLNLGTNQSGIDVYVNTVNPTVNRAYLATSQSATQREFYIVNVSAPSSPNTTGLGSYETNGMSPTGLTVVTGGRAIIVGTGGTYQYQVIDIQNETGNPLNECGPNAHLAYATGIRGVASVLQSSGYAYSYVITGDATSELKVILGGAGGTFTYSGTFESAIYDSGYAAAYNRFTATVTQPPQTTLKAQVAVAAPVSGDCTNASYEYVGPNGDSAQYFTPSGSFLSGIIPFGTHGTNYQNPERCFRYKLWFTSSDITQTPILYDLTINYSP